MAIEKKERIISITIGGKGADGKAYPFDLSVGTEVSIWEDGEYLSSSVQRKVWFPDDDVSNEPDQVKNLAATSWTDEVKAKWDEINPRKITSGPGSDFPKKLDEDGNPLPDRENAHLLDQYFSTLLSLYYSYRVIHYEVMKFYDPAKRKICQKKVKLLRNLYKQLKIQN